MDNIKRFDNQPIRTAWDEEKEEWFFSVSDVVEVLSESKDVKQYIKKMRSRDPELNSKWGTICTPVRMITADGKCCWINQRLQTIRARKELTDQWQAHGVEISSEEENE